MGDSSREVAMPSTLCPQCSAPIGPTVPVPPRPAARGSFQRQDSLRSLFLAVTMVAILLGWGRDHWLLQRKIESLVEGGIHDLRSGHEAAILDLEKQLEEGQLWQSRIQPAGRDVVASLPATCTHMSTDVTEIVLWHPAGDDDVAKLKRLSRLERVRLYGKQFTDRAVEHLEDAPSLRFAYLYGLHLTDQSIATLGRMSRLEEIYLNDMRLSDDSLAALRALPNLHTLHLKGTLISAGALKHIAEMASLRTLSLEQTPIGDESLEPLSQMKGLEKLNLLKSNVTTAGADQLRLALPNCLIVQ